jgi:hypothetical protein
MAASSSGPAAPPDDSGMVVQPEEASPMHVEGEPVSHRGRIFVDRAVNGIHFVTDVVTLESKSLPAGMSWEVIIHPDTERAVLLSSGDDVIVVDEYMATNVYTKPGTSDIVMVETKKDGEVVQKRLDSLKTKLREGVLSIKVGISIAFFDMSVYMFLRQRGCGNRLYFNIVTVYKALGLTQYKGQPTKWFYAQHKAWLRRLDPFLGLGSIVLSTACNTDDTMPFTERCLPRFFIYLCPQGLYGC